MTVNGHSDGHQRHAMEEVAVSRKIRTLALALAATLAVAPFVFAQSQSTILRAGAARLVHLQADATADNAGNGSPDSDPDDGGWDGVNLTVDIAHSSNASSTNAYGVSAIGMALALSRNSASISALVACLDTYSGIVANPAIASGPDPTFLFLLRRLTSDQTFADEARNRWDLAINSLGAGDVEAAGRAIKQARIDQGIPDIYPWDISWFVISATRLDNLFPGEGFALSASLLSQVVLNDLLSPQPTFDVDDATRDYYDLGLIGAALTLRITNISPTQSTALLNRILSRQNPDGSWGFNDLLPGANLQSTAYAVIVTKLFRSFPGSEEARQAGADYLASLQAGNGGFPWGGGPTEVPQANSEILLALTLVAPSSPFVGRIPPDPLLPSPIATPLAIRVP